MITLHHCSDARSFRVLWMLEELQLDYRLELLPFPPRVRAPAYLKLNPLGTIPFFTDGDAAMTESSAICHYLATTHGDGALAVAPGEAGYGDYLDMLVFGEASLTFPQTLVFRYSRLEPPERRLPQAAEDYRRWFLGRLRGLEPRLARSPWMAAGRFTAADISVGYALLFAEVLGNGFGGSDAIADYWGRLQAREGFRRAKAAQSSMPSAADVAKDRA